MSNIDIIRTYIQTLIDAGINVPADVQAAIEAFWQRQLKDHGK